eukprot:4621546-Pyramimonas_sp.AAC.1
MRERRRGASATRKPSAGSVTQARECVKRNAAWRGARHKRNLPPSRRRPPRRSCRRSPLGG